MKEFDVSAIERAIGYTYMDKRLLYQAFTHASFSNENAEPCYERLEFIGDAAVGLAVSLELFLLFPDIDEGRLSKAKAALVSRQSLGGVSDALGLIEYLRVGKGDIRKNAVDSLRKKCDLFEAVIGAALLDSGDFNTVKSILNRLLGDKIKNIFDDSSYIDHKSVLLERYRGARFISETDGGLFVARLIIDGRESAKGCGKSKKEAEQAAAAMFLSGKA